MTESPAVPDAVLAVVRECALGLPEAYEEEAWVGVRWRVGSRTFAHVLVIADGRPPAYARAASTAGPAVVLMFRSGGDELTALRATGAPFFAPPWRADEVGMVVGDAFDAHEVAELITESYCRLAPKRLVDRVGRPPDRDR